MGVIGNRSAHHQRVAIAQEIGDRRGGGNALNDLGVAYAALGDAPHHRALRAGPRGVGGDVCVLGACMDGLIAVCGVR
jgi:hypothetical protein